MLELKRIRENKDEILAGYSKRGLEFNYDVFNTLEGEYRNILAASDAAKTRKNTIAKEVGMVKKNGGDATALIEEGNKIGEEIKELEWRLTESETKLNEFVYGLPNIPHESVPAGRDESDNVVVRNWGEIKQITKPLSHDEIAEKQGIIDFERGTKIAKARFTLLKGQGAKLERALINFMLDVHTKNGYEEVATPFLVNPTSMFGTGQLPKFEEELFKCADDELYLIPTAEVPVTNIHANEIIDNLDNPVKYTAYTPCFRREAGSYGKDTKGLIRLHQFNKVELVKFAKPENSYDELEKLTNDAENILQLLGLPYRVILLCGGDMGFGSAKTYDIEVWMPSQNKYREISSCSNFEEFQARRAKIRFRREKGGKTEFVHTLNGSALAIGRTMAAIIENYQTPDGNFDIPEILKKYM